MFSFGGNLLAGQHDTQKKRPAPSKPIPVTFPSLKPPAASSSSLPSTWTTGGQAGLAKQFLTIKKPSDVNEHTLLQLNVTFQSECDFETLLSSLSNNAQAHLPPKDWLDPPEHIDLLMGQRSAIPLLSNGRHVPDQKEFYVRARELMFANDDAFCTLTRKSRRGPVTLRLAHFRKFWEGLDNMAYYWDNTLDDYGPPSPRNAADTVDSSSSDASQTKQVKEKRIETKKDKDVELGPTSSRPAAEEPRKKAKTGTAEAIGSSGYKISSLDGIGPALNPIRMLPARAAPPRAPWPSKLDPQTKTPDLSKGSYKGYRIGNGAEMPDQYRIDCVRAFVEGIAWAFGITFAQHRRPPVLELENVRFPVRMSSVAWRGHPDRLKSRQGWIQGPVMGIQCRADVNFGGSGNLDADSVLDAVRELGGLLLLAQERLREGKVEIRSGEGKWWTTKERWGGGPGGEVGDAQNASNVEGGDSAHEQEKTAPRNLDGSRARKRPSPIEIWKTLKPGHPLWDSKVIYEAIGKNKNVAWDDVFMVSSLNHHISVLRLRVHPAYLHYVTEGVLPTETPADPDWHSPKLQRTPWYNLFDKDDRVEAMRGIWGVTSYLMRQEASDIPDLTMRDT